MEMFLIRSSDAEGVTTWIVNAESKKKAIEMVKDSENFCEGEDILCCDKLNKKEKGIIYIEYFSNLTR